MQDFSLRILKDDKRRTRERERVASIHISSIVAPVRS